MVTGRTGQDGKGNNIPRDQMIHDVFCNNLIAIGVPCPSMSDFQFTCLPNGGTPTSCSGGAPDETVMVTVNLNKPPLIPFFPNSFLQVELGFSFTRRGKTNLTQQARRAL